MSDLKTLASSVVLLGEESQETTGRLLVLESAVLALVRSHPDHERFAEEFRRCWQLFGSQHSNPDNGELTLMSISEALDRLEASCPVPLGVRPDR
ncbi:MAG: hypothetical protein ACYC3A_05770 [Halothiobacillus sp.]